MDNAVRISLAEITQSFPQRTPSTLRKIQPQLYPLSDQRISAVGQQLLQPQGKMMFTLSVVFGSASVGFMFKTQESAESAAASLLEIATGDGFKMGIPPGSRISIKDDFGQHGIFNASSIHGVIIEDLEQTQLARAEQMVHQARCQNKAAKLAQADPALRMMNSPAMINPMGNGMIR